VSRAAARAPTHVDSPAKRRAAANAPLEPIGWADVWGNGRGGGDRSSVVGRRPFAWQVPRRTEGPPAILALDVAARSGWCWIGPTGDYRAGEIERTHDVTTGWALALDQVLSTHVGLVLIEAGSPGFAGRLPIPALSVERYVGAALGLCALRGLPAVRVVASTWQRALFGEVPRAQGKAVALAIARRHFGGAITSEDVADASCMALWGRGGRL